MVTKDSIKSYIPRTPQAFLGLISSMNSNRAKTWYRTEKEMTSNNIRVKQVQTSKQSQVGPGEHTDRSPQNSCGAWSHMLYVINVHNAEGVKKSSRERVKAGKIAISRRIKSQNLSQDGDNNCPITCRYHHFWEFFLKPLSLCYPPSTPHLLWKPALRGLTSNVIPIKVRVVLLCW